VIDIQPLTSYDESRFMEIASGYTSNEMYSVHRADCDALVCFTLELESLDQPFIKRWKWDDSEHEINRHVVAQSRCSFGAYDSDTLVGVAIAEPRAWHNDLWVWDFHVHAGYRRKGIGRQLMDSLAERAREHTLRTIVCETQNTNVPAIRFYRNVGFELAGVDLWYYPPEIDEVALFMKRRLGGPAR
jgi:ribosomal protein S18 acetylase RimI-like enzyme